MHLNEKTFLTESRKKVFDLEHRRRMNFSLNQADNSFKTGRQQFSDLGTAKKIAKNIKWNVIEHLNKYLMEFETRFINRGGKVIWAENSRQALESILNICKKNQVKTIVKGKSIVTEEIHLNQFLTSHDIEVLETDLGEYIQQLSSEPPYHIVAPSLHKSKEDIAELFHEKLDVPPNLTPGQLTLVARDKLRKKFLEAEVGITGINYILPDIGGVAITENEGNAWLTACCPKIHIAITGIEKVLPSVHDLGLFWPLLATHGSGQKITVYNSIYTGPRQKNEIDGPEEMYVILLDNSRTKILMDTVARESLYCIRCGACLNVCPVYKNIGGHAYKATYSGPIGAVISPYLNSLEEYKHLSYASSLCGACTDICPVGIKLHEHLLNNRRNSVLQGASLQEEIGWNVWKYINKNRVFMDFFGGVFKNFLIKKLFKKPWGSNRQLPHFARMSFNKLWKRNRPKPRSDI